MFKHFLNMYDSLVQSYNSSCIERIIYSHCYLSSTIFYKHRQYIDNCDTLENVQYIKKFE